jgi:excisionase family DNA binding protein
MSDEHQPERLTSVTLETYARFEKANMATHKLLSGAVLDLRGLSALESTFLANLRRMAKSGMSFFEIERVAIGPGSPALQGWSRVTREIVDSRLYRVAVDIATRAGIAEGLILGPEHENMREQVPQDRSLMSVTQAANTLGISRAAVHKALQQKRLPHQRYGNVVLVSRDGVLRLKRERALIRRPPRAAAPRARAAASSRASAAASSRRS